MLSHTFTAFNTEIVLCCDCVESTFDSLAQKIEKHAQIFENKFSRFDSSSELAKINGKTSEKIVVSDEMLDVLLRAKKYYVETKGIFDPTVYGTLNRVGYNKSFDLLSAENPSKSTNGMHEKLSAKEKLTFGDVDIHQKNNVIAAPLGLKIDLGGIAKGYWVDQIKDLLDEQNNNYWISAGGDIYVKGKGAMNDGWQVAIQNPQYLDKDILSLTVPEQGYGIATSGITKRKGIHNGEQWHHIIDPRTDSRVENSILAVTVIAKTTTDADIMAKTVLILGVGNGLSMINGRRDTECIIVDKNLKMHISKGLKNFL